MPSVTFPGGSSRESWDPIDGYKQVDSSGNLIIQRPLTPEELARYEEFVNDPARDATAETLRQQARAAIAAINTYLDLVDANTATNADHIAMVPRLARICKALIRLEVAKDLLD